MSIESDFESWLDDAALTANIRGDALLLFDAYKAGKESGRLVVIAPDMPSSYYSSDYEQGVFDGSESMYSEFKKAIEAAGGMCI